MTFSVLFFWFTWLRTLLRTIRKWHLPDAFIFMHNFSTLCYYPSKSYFRYLCFYLYVITYKEIKNAWLWWDLLTLIDVHPISILAVNNLGLFHISALTCRRLSSDAPQAGMLCSDISWLLFCARFFNCVHSQNMLDTWLTDIG